MLCVGGRWLWTRYWLPDSVWEQLLPQRDDQICMQELLAVPLAYCTFAAVVEGALWFLYVDNQGVLHGLLSGRAGADDLNYAVGQAWLDMTSMGISMTGTRVESKANVADGPTRDYFEILVNKGATFVEPRLPSWVFSLWAWPDRV